MRACVPSRTLTTRVRGSLLLAVLLVAPVVSGLQDRELEFKVKAAFLYNFARYTTWPAGTFADAEAPIVFGVLGRESLMVGALERLLKDKTVDGRPIEVRRLHKLEGTATCQLLFVDESFKEQLPQLFVHLREWAVFTVSDLPEMTRVGGVGRFLIDEEGKVEFEINTDAAARHRLEISSQLLKLARLVRDPER